MKVVIIGGVAGGATCATRIRRLDENADIVIFERSGYVSYANCGLPYYIGNIIKDKSELTLQTPKSFHKRFNIDVRVRHEVTAINKDEKTVTVHNLETGEICKESYDKLVMSPGARPVKPDMPGIDSSRLFFLRTVEDTYKISEFIKANSPESAAIVGGGYIGLEMAENLSNMGIKVTLLQRPGQLMSILDYDMSTVVHSKIRQNGIDLRLSSDVIGFEEEGDFINVKLKNTDKIKAKMVIFAIGVVPDSTLAKSIGIETGIKDSIVVNDKMETSVKDIYAVGDAVQIRHIVTGKEAVISLAGPANKQGRVAADNICGEDSHYNGSMGSSILKVFDMTVASTGLTEKAARLSGIDCDRVVLSPSSHAGYYPGARTMTMKVVFDRKTCRALGAQIIGYEGVDKRIDVMATAISFGVAGDRLKELDLAYAPPYSSAKDPVNMAGFMIENILKGKVKQFHWEEMEKIVKNKNATLLDTRSAVEFSYGYVEGFINIPVDHLRENISRLDKSKPVYVMCQTGLRSYIACRILSQKGYDCYNFSGGYRFYESVSQEKYLSENSFPCGMDRN